MAPRGLAAYAGIRETAGQNFTLLYKIWAAVFSSGFVLDPRFWGLGLASAGKSVRHLVVRCCSAASKVGTRTAGASLELLRQTGVDASHGVLADCH